MPRSKKKIGEGEDAILNCSLILILRTTGEKATIILFFQWNIIRVKTIEPQRNRFLIHQVCNGLLTIAVGPNGSHQICMGIDTLPVILRLLIRSSVYLNLTLCDHEE